MIEVYTGIRKSDTFHLSKDCAPGVMKRTKCTLREAIEAQRYPCGNCVDDGTREIYDQLYDEVIGQ